MKLDIIFIYADNCKHCLETLHKIENISIIHPNITCQIERLAYNNPKAIDLAIEYDIDDLPGVIINRQIALKGKNIDIKKYL